MLNNDDINTLIKIYKSFVGFCQAFLPMNNDL